ncbi:transcriptional regulator swi6 [Quaeritorhiza haematococci]|nr:transcriptional regulator swi6 [Quaeritorhiza haematococci]
MATLCESKPTEVKEKIYLAIYSGVSVYEIECQGISVMRRTSDSYLNATQVLKVAGLSKPKRTKILEREVMKGQHEKIQGGYGKYQGTWLPLKHGRELAIRYNVENQIKTLLDFDPATETPYAKPTKSSDTSGQQPRVVKRRIAKSASNTTASVDRTLPLIRIAPSVPQITVATAMVPVSGSAHFPLGTAVAAAAERHDDHFRQRPNHQNHESRKKKSKTTPSQTEKERVSVPSSTTPTFCYFSAMDAIKPHNEGNLKSIAERQSEIVMIMFRGGEVSFGEILDLLRDPEKPTVINWDFVVDADGHTLIHWAAAVAQIKLLRWLIHGGANSKLLNKKGETALMRAVMVTNNYVSKSFGDLLHILRDVVESTDSDGNTILHHIAFSSCEKEKQYAVRYYLQCLVDFFMRNASAPTVPDSVCDPSARSAPSSSFVSSARQSLLRLLNAKNRNGDTALHITCRDGRSRLFVEALLSFGADRNVMNARGQIPADLIREDSKVSQLFNRSSSGEHPRPPLHFHPYQHGSGKNTKSRSDRYSNANKNSQRSRRSSTGKNVESVKPSTEKEPKDRSCSMDRQRSPVSDEVPMQSEGYQALMTTVQDIFRNFKTDLIGRIEEQDDILQSTHNELANVREQLAIAREERAQLARENREMERARIRLAYLEEKCRQHHLFGSATGASPMAVDMEVVVPPPAESCTAKADEFSAPIDVHGLGFTLPPSSSLPPTASSSSTSSSSLPSYASTRRASPSCTSDLSLSNLASISESNGFSSSNTFSHNASSFPSMYSIASSMGGIYSCLSSATAFEPTAVAASALLDLAATPVSPHHYQISNAAAPIKDSETDLNETLKSQLLILDGLKTQVKSRERGIKRLREEIDQVHEDRANREKRCKQLLAACSGVPMESLGGVVDPLLKSLCY